MSVIDSAYAWKRLAAGVALSTVGGMGTWCLIVALPTVQHDLGVRRADVSFTYTMTMLGFCAGGIVMGRVVDARGVTTAVTASSALLALGFALAQSASSLALFTAAQVMMGFGAASTFGPWSRTSRSGSRSTGERPSRSRRRATISPARSGRRSSAWRSVSMAGGRPTSPRPRRALRS